LKDAQLITIWKASYQVNTFCDVLPTALSAHTILTTVHAKDEILASFQMPLDTKKWFAHVLSRPLPVLKLPERYRRAVLEYMQPLVYRAPGALTS